MKAKLRKQSKRWCNDGLKKNETVSDSMDDGSFVDGSASVWAIIHTAVALMDDGMDDGSVNNGSAIPYTTLLLFTLFSTLPKQSSR